MTRVKISCPFCLSIKFTWYLSLTHNQTKSLQHSWAAGTSSASKSMPSSLRSSLSESITKARGSCSSRVCTYTVAALVVHLWYIIISIANSSTLYYPVLKVVKITSMQQPFRNNSVSVNIVWSVNKKTFWEFVQDAHPFLLLPNGPLNDIFKCPD